MAGRGWTRKGWMVAAIVASYLALMGAAPAVPAAALDDLDVSLKWIPADAAFYSAMLRNREQIEIIGKSKAWARLMAMPVVQEGFKKYDEAAADPENPAAKFKAGLANPAVQDVLALLADMGGRDIFLYGGDNFVDFLDLMQKINAAQRSGQLMQLSEGPGGDQAKNQARAILHMLAVNRELIHIPDTIIGFRVENTQRAKENVDKVMGFAMLASMATPELANWCKRTTIGEVEYTTLTLAGSMIPWDQVPLDDARENELEKGDVDKLVSALKELKLVIALGVRDDYLLLSIGESTDALGRLGSGQRLIEREELKPLAAFADKPLTSISYVSKAMNTRLATSAEDLEQLVTIVDALLAQAELTDDQKARIRKDAQALAEDLKPWIPQPGAATAFSFLTDRGMESYSYSWTKAPGLEGGKPLGLLEHVGGSPLLAGVARGGNPAASYDLLAKWLKVGYRYFNEFAVKEMSESEREKYEKFVEGVRPLVKRLDEVNRQKLLPSLREGEAGVVLEGKLKSKQIAAESPAFEKPMPLPEGAVVLALSDAKLFRESLEAYREIANGVIDVLHQLEPDDVPDFEIPAPKEKKSKAGTVYQYPLPEEIGLDKQIGPTVGVSESVAVLSLSRKQPGRLLEATPLAVGGVLAEAGRARAGAFVLQWPAMVDTAAPWVDLVAREAMKKEHVEADEAQKILDQVHTVLDVLKAMRTLTVEAYLQDDAVVSHSMLEVRDVE